MAQDQQLVEIASGTGWTQLTNADATAITFQVRAVLRCKTTDGNWAVDDEVDIPDVSYDGTAEQGWAVACNATNVKVVRGVNATATYDASTGNAHTYTDGNWRVVVYAVRLPS